MAEPRGVVAQVYVTDAQAGLISVACQRTIESEELDPALIGALASLRDFFIDVSERPQSYPVTGHMARTLKTRARRLKGPAERRSKKHQAAYQAAKAEKAARKARQRGAGS